MISMGCAFRLHWCVGSLQGPWYGWVDCVLEVASSVQRCLIFQVSPLQKTAPHLCCLCPTPGLATLAIVFACLQLVTQLVTHEVREPSRSLARSGLNSTVLRVARPPPVQQILHQRCELRQPSRKLRRPPRENSSQHPAPDLLYSVKELMCAPKVSLPSKKSSP